MKKVILKSLTLTNWRGERSRTTQFNPESTTISGANGLGKSRHFDAFMWLLFGKDSQDRKDFNIKTVVDGKPLMKVECEVVGVLSVNGEIITLRRALVEEWVKPRGKVEQVFKGNKTECYWNDVPVNVSEYQKRVSEIIDDSLFKMVTNPLFFATMPWKNQREQLFQLAGTVTNEELASKHPTFAILLDSISGKSLEDFKKELAVRKKRLKADLDEIQPRIDQTQRLMPESADFLALEKGLANIEVEIAKTDKAISDITERIRLQYEAVQERQGKINALKSQRQQVLFDAQSKAKEEAFNANAKRRELQEQINSIKREIHGYVQDENSANAELERLQEQVHDGELKSNALREEWYKVNESIYEGETKCHCCGQELPEEMKANALTLFNRHKQERLDEITSKGKSLKAEIEDANSRISEVEQDKNNAISGAKAKVEELHTLEEQLATHSEVKQEEVRPDNLKEYTDLTKQIAELEASLDAETEKVDTSELQEKKKALLSERDSIKSRLADRERIEQFKEQISELEHTGRGIAQQIADAEHEEYTVRQFTKAKIEECEKRINSLFSMVTFQLFDYTIEDTLKENPIETCILLVNGVPFSVANTADQFNGGLDIINTLCNFYGITVPIFIDGRESVNEIIPTQSQVINLVVTDDKELTIK